MGDLIGTVGGVSDPYECLTLCKNIVDCTWYTANPNIGGCNLYSTCTVNVVDCPDCLSGG